MINTNHAAPADALTHYLAEAKKYPVLDAETEASLVKRWQKDRDPAAGRLTPGVWRGGDGQSPKRRSDEQQKIRIEPCAPCRRGEALSDVEP